MTEEEKKKKAADDEAAANKRAEEDVAKKPKAPTLKAGTRVNLVHANGAQLPAKVTAVRKDDYVDLKTDGGIVITSSPFDPTGKQADSWHYHTGPNSADEAVE